MIDFPQEKYICLNNCNHRVGHIQHYFSKGKVYKIRMYDRSKYCYIEINKNHDISVEKEFVKTNFVVNDEVFDEVNNLFNNIFFENGNKY